MNNPKLSDKLIDTPDMVRESPNFRYGTNAIKDESEGTMQFIDDGGVWEGKPINTIWFYVLGTFGVLIFVFSLFLLIAERTMNVYLGGLK